MSKSKSTDNKKIQSLRRQLKKIRNQGAYSDYIPGNLRKELRSEIIKQASERKESSNY